MKIAECKMQIFVRKLIQFSIFNLIFAICNDVYPILQTANLLRFFLILSRFYPLPYAHVFMIASAALIPSRAELTIPPAYPDPSPQG